MEAVFSVIFSGTVISDDKKYGPIGVVFALMSWLIAIGVVIILGAVAGIVWQERNLSFRAASRNCGGTGSAPEGNGHDRDGSPPSPGADGTLAAGKTQGPPVSEAALLPRPIRARRCGAGATASCSSSPR